ncbi:putative cytosolic protein [Granulibacter bethesdensis]|uniref:polyphenol oxidase family protein n=1 Tax=Granulibacter bethesdensis TaxID=364410 RepID=UPI00090B7143|nr:polyphenol oxidase family protein [Granulibacter bethesdensis]APH58150.1 putative cytosolic protein [Granulibacter bethesdensis]
MTDLALAASSLPERITGSLAAPHGFFTRRGGVSSGPYASLNGSLSGGDDPVAVHENRARIAHCLGADTLLGLRQVHSTTVIRVETPWAAGSGPDADAMITDRPGIALGVITADCGPVLFEGRRDDGSLIVGAAHAGWRGAVAGILEATADSMRAWGAVSLRACVGPCIARNSYEVGADLRAALLAADPDGNLYLHDGRDAEHWQFDLPGYCLHRLTRNGIEAEALFIDTLTDAERFYSHRRRTLAGGGAIGHQVSAILCPKPGAV